MHGIAAWFDVSFDGTEKTVKLSTGPYTPGTHWYQCRLLLRKPIAVNETQTVSGHLKMTVNEKFSYNISLTSACQLSLLLLVPSPRFFAACCTVSVLRSDVRWHHNHR